MASPAVNVVTNLMSGLASAIYTFAGLILVSAIVALIEARKWAQTKRARQAIYSVVGSIGT